MHPWHPCWIYVCCWIRDQQNLCTGCNEVVAKVMFLLMCVILCTGGGGGGCAIPACIAGGIPACLAAGLGRGGWVSQHALQASRSTPKGEVRGICPGVCPGPHPRVKFRGSVQGGVQAHTQGRSLGGSVQGGVQAHTQGGSFGGVCSRGCLLGGACSGEGGCLLQGVWPSVVVFCYALLVWLSGLVPSGLVAF